MSTVTFHIMQCVVQPRITSLVFLIGFTSMIFQETVSQRSYFFEAKDKKPFDYYKIVDDPKQVKPDEITQENLFSWLNIKNSVKFKLWTRKYFCQRRKQYKILNSETTIYPEFRLYVGESNKRLNPHLAHEVKYNNLESLQTSNFDNRRVTKILIHGYADTATSVAVTYYLFHMRDSYLSALDVNVFIVDYSLFMIPIFYWASNITVAAERLAEFLQFMVKYAGLKLSSVHLIGFSMGGHLAGLCGKTIQDKTGLKVGRITGLDPAGPTFHYLENDDRLDSSDAEFVDIIHTNAGRRLLFRGDLGLPVPLGHVDVYPNGGQTQSGCPEKTPVIYETLECSHGRSARYFIESITSPLAFPLVCPCDNFKKYISNECLCKEDETSVSFMGEHISHKTRGIFQLITKSHMPFGLGPHLNISLLSAVSQHSKEKTSKLQILEKHIDSSTVDDGRIIVHYKNKTYSIGHPNRFNSKDYPNDDIVNTCLSLIRK